MADLTHIKEGDVVIHHNYNRGKMEKTVKPCRVRKVTDKMIYLVGDTWHEARGYYRDTGRPRGYRQHSYITPVEDSQ